MNVLISAQNKDMKEILTYMTVLRITSAVGYATLCVASAIYVFVGLINKNLSLFIMFISSVVTRKSRDHIRIHPVSIYIRYLYTSGIIIIITTIILITTILFNIIIINIFIIIFIITIIIIIIIITILFNIIIIILIVIIIIIIIILITIIIIIITNTIITISNIITIIISIIIIINYKL